MKLNDVVRLYKQQYMPKPKKGGCITNNNNDNEAGKKKDDDDEEKQEANGGKQPAITAHFPSEGANDQTEIDHSKDPDRAATMLHEIQEQAKLGLEDDSDDDFASDGETEAICAMFGVGRVNIDLDGLADNVSSGMIDDDDLDSIDDNDEDSIGGGSPLARQLRDDCLPANNATSDFPQQVNIASTHKCEAVINSSNDDDSSTKVRSEILDAAQPTTRTFNDTYTMSTVEYDFTGDDKESNIGFQFTESETIAMFEHFHNRPHLKPEMQTHTTKPYDTDWNIFSPYLNLFLLGRNLLLLGWKISTYYLDLFLLRILIKFVEFSIDSLLSVLYSFIGLLDLADHICDTLCPPCFYLLHSFTTTVLNLLPDFSVSFYGLSYHGRQTSSGKGQWRLGSRRRRNYWQQDHCNQGS